MSYLEKFGFVYLIGDGRFLKIGETSGCPTQRMRELQTGNANRLSLVAVFECGDRKELEAYLHSEFSGVRVGGEWFDISVEQVIELADMLEATLGATLKRPLEIVPEKPAAIKSTVVDSFVSGDTLFVITKSNKLAFTIRSENQRSKLAGKKQIELLERVLGGDSSKWPGMQLTYRKIKSPYLVLNHYEIITP